MANLSHLPELWRKSGLSQRAFCEQHNGKLATFSYWRKKQIASGAPASSPAAAFAELHVAPPPRRSCGTHPRSQPPPPRSPSPTGTTVRILVPGLMLALSPHVKLYLYVEPCDMRKGFDGLSGVVRAALAREPDGGGGVYVFVNRRRDRLKLLTWEPGSFAIYY